MFNHLTHKEAQSAQRASIFWPTAQVSEHKRATDMYKKYDKYYTCLCSECRVK